MQRSPQVTAEFPQNFRAMALGHRLRNEIADPVRKQRVSPEHLHAGRLVREVRLMGQHNGHQPIRVLERHQSAGARLISAELSHPIEKCGVLQRNGKRLPTGLRDATVKGRGIAKLRLALRQLFPESPAATICLGQLSGRARHRTQAGGIGHGAVLQEDKVAVIHGNHFAFVPPQATDAGHDELAVFGLVIEVCHLAIRDQTPWAASHVCKGRTRESYWL